MNSVITSIKESPMQQIHHPLLRHHNVQLSIKRDDLYHPLIQGNKWRKLKYNLAAFQASECRQLLTFGGPFSNHLYATAAAGKLFGISTIGIVRGPELDMHNPTLRFAHACGMKLVAVTRKDYRLRQQKDYLSELKQRFGNVYILPEGGTNHAALRGVAELAQKLPGHDYLVCATGSGGTLAGLCAGHTQRKVLGIAVLKNADYLNHEISKLTSTHHCDWQLMQHFHDGGYGRFSDKQWRFCQDFRATYQVPLEPIYTGKMMYALWQLIAQGYFPPGSRIIAVHTGGLQGLNGLRYRGLLKAT